MTINDTIPATIAGSTDESLYKNIIEQSRDIIFVVATDGKIRYANQAASDAYGYSNAELQVMRIHDLRSPDTRSKVDEQLKLAQQEGTVFRTHHLRKNGECFTVEVSSRRFSFLEGEAVVSVVRDITDTVSMESALVKSEEKFRHLNEELMTANEELTASDEELRQQFDELLGREEAIRQQNVILASLHETTLGLMHRLDLDDVLEAIVSSATKLLDAPDGFINLADEAAGVFVRTAAVGIFKQDVARITGLADGLVGQAYLTGKIAVVNDYNSWEHRASDPFFDGLYSFVVIPLKSGDKVVGGLGLAFTDSGRTFAAHELLLLQRFADLASIALDNATLATSYQKEIQERVLTEAALRANQIELQKSQTSNLALINALPDLMFILKKDGTFTDYKTSKEQPYISPDLFLGKTVFEVFPKELAATTIHNVQLAIETEEVQIFEYDLSVRGLIHHYEARIVVCGENQVLAISRNITDRKRMEEQLKHLSLHDSLTELYNRAFFEEQMRRFEKENGISAGLLICDVDGLKIINDTLGHSMGDAILKIVAFILKDSFRPGDLVARIGGDEFAVFLPSSSEKELNAGCRRITEKVDLYNEDNPTVPISLSLGYAVSQQTPVDMNALFKEADNNMYREKLHRQKSARSAIVQALIKALEVRDFITEGHSNRLQELVESLAIAVGLPEQSLADLRLLAHFHDIGKVGIPDSILFKTSHLTEDEWVVMRSHCEIGYRIAMAAPDLAPIADWVLKHQEWWDGKGYPMGIAGEDIPLACRILAIADAYDAMTNDRPYRKAMPQKEAVDELQKCAGTQFDPILTKSFIEMIETNFSSPAEHAPKSPTHH